MLSSFFVRSRFLSAVTVAVSALLVTPMVCPAAAHDSASLPRLAGNRAVVLGSALRAAIDQRDGSLAVDVSLASLPGLGGRGAADLELHFDQSRAESASASDSSGFGDGWNWGLTAIDVDNGVVVQTSLGERFVADASWASGLAGYPTEDLHFAHETGVLPPRDDAHAEIAYQFVLSYVGGTRDFFSPSGRLVAREDLFGARVEWQWSPKGRLEAVTDHAGNAIRIRWNETSVDVVSPTRFDGVTPLSRIDLSNDGVTRIVDPVGQSTAVSYDNDGYLSRIAVPEGAVGHISYQRLPDGSSAVDALRAVDALSGQELAGQTWDVVGDNLAPKRGGAASGNVNAGDGAYRYRTQVSESGVSVINEYDVRDRLLSRQIHVATPAGDYVAQEETFVYSNVGEGDITVRPSVTQGVKPIETRVTYRDADGRSRSVSELVDYDSAGRVVRSVAADGTITETSFDSHIPDGSHVPFGLVTETTVTGGDGLVSTTLNTLVDDHRSVATSVTLVGPNDGERGVSARFVTVTDADGFVREEHVVPTSAESPSDATTYARQDDQASGAITYTTTRAAGSEVASSTSVAVDRRSGLVVRHSDETGRVAHVNYDALGRVIERVDEAGRVWATEYTPNTVSTTTPDGIRQTQWTDSLGRLVKTSDNLAVVDPQAPRISTNVRPAGGAERATETRSYAADGATTVTDARGQQTTTSTDVLGRPVQVSVDGGPSRIIHYDDVAGATSEGLTTSPERGLLDALAVTNTQTDDRGRTVRVDGERSDKKRVPSSTTTFDGLGRVAEMTRDDLATRVARRADGTPQTTVMRPEDSHRFPGDEVWAERSHNSLGVSTNKVLSRYAASDSSGDAGPQPSGLAERSHGVSRETDVLGRTTVVRDQAGETTRVSYTPDGLAHETVTSVTTTTTTYDPVTRDVEKVVMRSQGGAEEQKQYEYDPVTGRLRGIHDPTDIDNTRIDYVYDVFGNTVETRYPDGNVVAHEYDERGREISTTDITGAVTRFEYGRNGLLDRVSQAGPDGVGIVSMSYTYDTYGRVIQATRGENGVLTRYTYTSANDVASEITTRPDGGVIFAGDYDYDDHGNLTRKTVSQENVASDDEISEPRVETTMYGFNVYNQLTESRVFAGREMEGEPLRHTRYDVGVSGNVRAETTIERDYEGPETSSQTTHTREFEYNALGQTVATITNGERKNQRYDNAGNLVESADGTELTYNIRNQPTRETRTDGTTIETRYWADGHVRSRTTRSVGRDADRPASETIRYYWDEQSLSNEIREADGQTSTSRYAVGPARFARTLSDHVGIDDRRESTEYYVADRHGSTVAMLDVNGRPQTTYVYGDYGTAHTQQTPAAHGSALPNGFMYSGEYTTWEGRQLLGDRSYDPYMHAFTTRDTADEYDLYAYARANPVVHVDPTGNTPEPDRVATGLTLGVAMLSLACEVAFFASPPAGLSLLSLGVSLVGIAGDVAQAVDAVHLLAAKENDDAGDFASGSSDALQGGGASNGGLAGIIMGAVGAGILGGSIASVAVAGRPVMPGRFVRVSGESRLLIARTKLDRAISALRPALESLRDEKRRVKLLIRRQNPVRSGASEKIAAIAWKEGNERSYDAIVEYALHNRNRLNDSGRDLERVISSARLSLLSVRRRTHKAEQTLKSIVESNSSPSRSLSVDIEGMKHSLELAGEARGVAVRKIVLARNLKDNVVNVVLPDVDARIDAMEAIAGSSSASSLDDAF